MRAAARGEAANPKYSFDRISSFTAKPAKTAKELASDRSSLLSYSPASPDRQEAEALAECPMSTFKSQMNVQCPRSPM